VIDRRIQKLIGARGRVVEVAFRDRERRFRASVPDDNLWGAVKDILILREYDGGETGLGAVRGGVVIDAGAHVGLFSLLASTRARTVIALEPHAANLELLESNVVQNSVENVELQLTALGGVSGSVGFIHGEHSGSGRLCAESDAAPSSTVAAVTLDDLLEYHQSIALLKLDIEGAEFDVLEAASDFTLSKIEMIVAELHTAGRADSESALVRRLRLLGFDVSVMDPPVVHWRYSMRRLVTTWPLIEDQRRLKVVVALVYSLIAALRLVSSDHQNPKYKQGLRLLYARRGEQR
jgi:FkbM family methyltransferase